jgi:hypothetical protein
MEGGDKDDKEAKERNKERKIGEKMKAKKEQGKKK